MKEADRIRTEGSKQITIPVTVTKLDLDTLRRRFERKQKRYPHKLNPPLTDEWVLKYCVFESKNLEIKHLIKRIKTGKI
jgi:hypothetical protein